MTGRRGAPGERSGGSAAPGLRLTDARPYAEPGRAVLDDDVLDLLPGERARASVTWRPASAEGRTVQLEGWNIRATELR